MSIRHAVGDQSSSLVLDGILRLQEFRCGKSLAGWVSAPLEQGALHCDVTVDLTGGSASPERGATLTLDLDGNSGLSAALRDAMIPGRGARLAARLDGDVIAVARPMAVDPIWLPRACDTLLSANIALVLQSVARFFYNSGGLLDGETRPSCRQGFLSAFIPSAARGGWGRLRGRVSGSRPFYWQVAYRAFDPKTKITAGPIQGKPFNVLKDDGARFYADPFVVEHEGSAFLFVEEYPYATGKGIISVSVLDGQGQFSTPTPVLEEPHHLSYPQVFFEDGFAYMIPESGKAGQVVLYRATDFPISWVRDTVLIEGFDLNDGTLLRHAGRYWLIATERVPPGSASDTMVIFSSSELKGPYEPHRLNPVAVDCTMARPGGSPFLQDGRLLLPVQDGSHRYGGGLGIMEIGNLSLDTVNLHPPIPVMPGSTWPGRQIHTLSTSEHFEVVDGAV